MIKVIPHGLLAARFPTVEIDAKTAAEAIEGWSRQVGISPLRDPVVRVVGFETEESLYMRTGIQELHLFPALYGGGGVGKILIGAALVAVAIIFATALGFLAPIIASMGATLILSGVMELFMKSPAIDKSADPPASKYLGASENTTAIGTLIPLAGGRMLGAGQWLTLQVDSNDMVIGKFPETVPA